jgi:hypothetical protein
MVTAVLIAAGSIGGILLASGSHGSMRQSDITVPPKKAAAIRAIQSMGKIDGNPVSSVPAPPPVVADPIPAELFRNHPLTPFPPSVIDASTSWGVSDGFHYVAVYVGADGGDATQGKVIIVRQNRKTRQQTLLFIEPRATGRLTIIHAPRGASVESSAGTGKLRLASASGHLLTLDLSTNILHEGKKEFAARPVD